MGKKWGYKRDFNASVKTLPSCMNKLIEEGVYVDWFSVQNLPAGHPFRKYDIRSKIDVFASFIKLDKVPQTIQELQDLQDSLVPIGARSNLKNDDQFIILKDTEVKVLRSGLVSGQKFDHPDKFLYYNTKLDYECPTTIFLVKAKPLLTAYDVMNTDGTLINKYRKPDCYGDGREYNHFSVSFVEFVSGEKVWDWPKNSLKF